MTNLVRKLSAPNAARCMHVLDRRFCSIVVFVLLYTFVLLVAVFTPGAPGVKFSTPESPGIKFMNGGGFPIFHYMNIVMVVNLPG